MALAAVGFSLWKGIVPKGGQPPTEEQSADEQASVEPYKPDQELQDFYDNYIKENGPQAAVSGAVDISGTIFKESKLVIKAKPHLASDSEYKVVVDGVVPQDGAAWTWPDADVGKMYDIKAELVTDEKLTDDSNVVTAAAPAQGELLKINSSHTPEEVFGTATISGTIALSGNVPADSGIAIYQKKVEDTDYTLITDKIAAQNGAAWSWDAAVQGQKYDLQGVFFVGGKPHGSSQVDAISVHAPADSEVLKIVSDYEPTDEKVVVSGKVKLNGPIPNYAKIAIYVKDYDQQEDQYKKVGSDLPAYDGVEWSWDQAEKGKKYHMKAKLEKKSDNKSIAVSQPQNVRAPESSIEFKINVTLEGRLDAPHQASVKCETREGDKWKVHVKMDKKDKAKKYYLMVGSDKGKSDVFGSKIDSNEHTVKNVKNNKSYYVQYSYMECEDCVDLDKISHMSAAKKFKCD